MTVQPYFPSCSVLKIMPCLFQSGLTPLHVASFMGCMNIVIYLLQHDASPDVPTVRGETPLHLAARANQTDIIRILLRNGAQVDARARVSGLACYFYTITNPTHKVVHFFTHYICALMRLSVCRFQLRICLTNFGNYFNSISALKFFEALKLGFIRPYKKRANMNSTFILLDIGNTDNLLK